jgi:hypothetical protein
MTLTEEQIDQIAQRVADKLRSDKKVAYNITEAAAALGLCTKTIRRMIEAGLIRKLRGTAKIIIPATEIERITNQ